MDCGDAETERTGGASSNFSLIILLVAPDILTCTVCAMAGAAVPPWMVSNYQVELAKLNANYVHILYVQIRSNFVRFRQTAFFCVKKNSGTSTAGSAAVASVRTKSRKMLRKFCRSTNHCANPSRDTKVFRLLEVLNLPSRFEQQKRISQKFGQRFWISIEIEFCAIEIKVVLSNTHRRQKGKRAVINCVVQAKCQ